jgi:hypothetical protein
MHYLFPFAFPIWLIGYPVISYLIGRFYGDLPTEAEWDSAAHSSGPWAHEFIIFFLGSILVGLTLHFFMIAISIINKNKPAALRWSMGLIASVAAAGFSFFQFGYLME